jgi:hypothetical protein
VAIGRRPAHPARSRAVKNGEISQPGRRKDAGRGHRRSVTRGTAEFEQLQWVSFAFAGQNTIVVSDPEIRMQRRFCSSGGRGFSPDVQDYSIVGFSP